VREGHVAAVIIIIILVVLVVAAVAARAAWNNTHRSVPPGPGNGALPPGYGQQPNPPGFTPLPPNGRGSFVEQHRTARGAPPPAPQPGSRGNTNSFGTRSINPTAICRLTGKRMADCTCDRCTKLKKKV
jgi:hypothetical protein